MDIKQNIMPLRSFVVQKMLTNHQPYRKLADLRKEIDKNPNMNNKMVIEKLQNIKDRYDHTRYEKTINKPRILYSMMVPR